MTVDVMLDLETLGTRPGAVILSIGAVKFSVSEETVSERFHQVISVASCVEAGLTMDPATVSWWMQQGNDARRVFAEPGVDLDAALKKFYAWMGGDRPVWGNGASFDNALLAEAYRITGVMKPWSFRNDRCYRTVRALLGHRADYHHHGIKHNAVDDAEAQATHLIGMLRKLG